MSNPNPTPPPVEYRFKPGQSGNPKGNVASLRQALQQDFSKALLEDFRQGGVAAIKAAREKDPMGYVKAVAGLMPKQFEQAQPLDDLNDAELVAGIALLQSRLATSGSSPERATQPLDS